MPAINRVKKYRKDTYYHIYNRGNNKEEIFFSRDDYLAFRNIFKQVEKELTPKIFLDTYSLLPNHYHFLVYQGSERSIEILMKRTMTRYVMYINKKYARVGRLFQDIYKASIVPEHRLNEVRLYILNNPIKAGLVNWEHCGSGRDL